ncbi:Uncharacterised protein [Mycobacteroides abscessus subsp. abscessus]|nr:Uncharacterised protein [Mycobacteroides abscessus subsp. abscessus]
MARSRAISADHPPLQLALEKNRAPPKALRKARAEILTQWRPVPKLQAQMTHTPANARQPRVEAAHLAASHTRAHVATMSGPLVKTIKPVERYDSSAVRADQVIGLQIPKNSRAYADTQPIGPKSCPVVVEAVTSIDRGTPVRSRSMSEAPKSAVRQVSRNHLTTDQPVTNRCSKCSRFTGRYARVSDLLKVLTHRTTQPRRHLPMKSASAPTLAHTPRREQLPGRSYA